MINTSFNFKFLTCSIADLTAFSQNSLEWFLHLDIMRIVFIEVDRNALEVLHLSGYKIVFLVTFKLLFIFLSYLIIELSFDLSIKSPQLLFFLKGLLQVLVYLQYGNCLYALLHTKSVIVDLAAFYNVAKILLVLQLFFFIRYVSPKLGSISYIKSIVLMLLFHILLALCSLYETVFLMDWLQEASIYVIRKDEYNPIYHHAFNYISKVDFYRHHLKTIRDTLTIFSNWAVFFTPILYLLCQLESIVLFLNQNKKYVPVILLFSLFSVLLCFTLSMLCMKWWLTIMTTKELFVDTYRGYHGHKVFRGVIFCLMGFVWYVFLGKRIRVTGAYLIFLVCSFTLAAFFITFQMIGVVFIYVKLGGLKTFVFKLHTFIDCVTALIFTGLFFYICCILLTLFFNLLYFVLVNILKKDYKIKEK